MKKQVHFQLPEAIVGLHLIEKIVDVTKLAFGKKGGVHQEFEYSYRAGDDKEDLYIYSLRKNVITIIMPSSYIHTNDIRISIVVDRSKTYTEFSLSSEETNGDINQETIKEWARTFYKSYKSEK